MKLAASALLAAALAVFAVACGSDDDDSSDGATIAASTGIMADIAEQVAGDDAEVVQVVPDGSSPHDFQLSAEDRATIEDSSLFVTNGAGLEQGIPVDEIDVEQFALADNVPNLLALEEEGAHENEEEGAHENEEEGAHEEEAEASEDHAEEEHEHGGEDPHVWMDPTRVAEALPALGDAFAEADPDNAEAYQERADTFAAELTALDTELEQAYASVPADRRNLVTSHDALGYLADRYGFEVVATPFPASGPEAEPSAQAIVEVEEAIRESDVPTVFAQEDDDPEVLRQIADRTGVAIVEDLLVEAPGSAGSYVEMLRRDAELISEGLAPDGATG